MREQDRFVTKCVWQTSHLTLQLLNTPSSHRGPVKYSSNSTLQIHEGKTIQGLQFQQNQWQSFGTGVTPGISHIFLTFPYLRLHSGWVIFRVWAFFFLLCTNHYGILIAAKCNVNPCDLNDVPLICNLLIKVWHGSAIIYTYSGWPSGLH